MKKYCFLLLFVLLFTCAAAQADSLGSHSGEKEARIAECYEDMEFKEEDGPWWVVISDREDDRLNLREKPNRNAKSLAKYFAGTIVHQLEEEKNGWMLVEIGTMTGYVDVEYLQPGIETKERDIKLVTVRNEGGTGANLRTSPNTENSKVVLTLKNQQTAYAIGVLPEGWLQIMYDHEYYFAKAPLFTPLLLTTPDEIYSGKTGIYYVYNPNPSDRLNLRKNPTATAVSFAKFYGGTQVLVTGFDAMREWARVKVMNLEGWMSTEYLKAKLTQTAMPETTVAAGGALLCTRPDDTAGSTTLSAGTHVLVYGFDDSGWAAITVTEASGFNGWVELKSLEETDAFSWTR